MAVNRIFYLSLSCLIDIIVVILVVILVVLVLPTQVSNLIFFIRNNLGIK